MPEMQASLASCNQSTSISQGSKDYIERLVFRVASLQVAQDFLAGAGI
jgi:hypothetical protein